ncbi:hypothetical protein LXA43DRAFT_750277 [Ganoderma leucocontextum]|nr:hypothetical protein LXA43DRAFT_750277 [Ganoderma leucocontextum]
MFAGCRSLRTLFCRCILFSTLGDLVHILWSFPHITEFAMFMGGWKASSASVDATEYPGRCRDLNATEWLAVPGWEAVLPFMGFNLQRLSLSPVPGNHAHEYRGAL